MTHRTYHHRSSTTAFSYVLKSNAGILSVFDVKTGKPHYQLQRLDGIPEVYSSPVAAKDRVYITAATEPPS